MIYQGKQKIWSDYQKDIKEYVKFHNELIADTIIYFAAEAQKVLQHKKLLTYP